MPPLKPQTVLFTLFLLAAVAAGFFAGRLSSKPSQLTSNPSEIAATPGAALFDNQTATITGRVVKASGDKLTIQDDKNQTAEFPVISTVLVSKPVNGRLLASQSGGVKNLELNTDVLVNLVLRDGEYVVTAITYLPPAPVFPVPPAAAKPTPSGQVKK